MFLSHARQPDVGFLHSWAVILNNFLGKSSIRIKTRGKGEFGRGRACGARKGERIPSSLLPRAWSRALIPLPFPFERLPRRLLAIQIWWRQGLLKEKKAHFRLMCVAEKGGCLNSLSFFFPGGKWDLSPFLRCCCFLFKHYWMSNKWESF